MEEKHYKIGFKVVSCTAVKGVYTSYCSHYPTIFYKLNKSTYPFQNLGTTAGPLVVFDHLDDVLLFMEHEYKNLCLYTGKWAKIKFIKNGFHIFLVKYIPELTYNHVWEYNNEWGDTKISDLPEGSVLVQEIVLEQKIKYKINIKNNHLFFWV